MKVQVKVLPFLAGVFALIGAAMTANGSMQEIIHFAGALNEMAFCFTSGLFGIGAIISSVSK